MVIYTFREPKNKRRSIFQRRASKAPPKDIDFLESVMYKPRRRVTF